MPIKTVHLTNYYHETSGGISTSLNNLLKAAEKHERFVTLIVPGKKDSVEKVNDFAKIYYVAAPYSPIFDKRYRLIMPWQYLRKNSVVRRILLKEKPDLIEITDKYILIFIAAMLRKGFFRSLGRPILVNFSSERMDDNVASFITQKQIGKTFAYNYITNILLSVFDFHIANSEYTAAEFFEAYKRVLEGEFSSWFFKKCSNFFLAPQLPIQERVFVCPRGVNIEFFSTKRQNIETRRQILQNLNLPHDSLLLLYAGRLSPEKNIELLIETMRILNSTNENFWFLVAGSGPKEEWLKQKSKELNNKILLLGHIDKEKLANIYANVDVYVHPNPREPFGNVVLEAMASGCPVVVPNSGGVLTYVNEQNAWITEPKPEKFASAIKEVVENPKLRQERIKNAVCTARENSSDRFAERLFFTYDKIYRIFFENREAFDFLGLNFNSASSRKKTCST